MSKLTKDIVTIAVIGMGNRANKYLEYVKRNSEKVKLIAVIENNEIRRKKAAKDFDLDLAHCYADYNDFFLQKREADAVFICTPEDKHFDPCMKAIKAGYHVLLEKPIAQNLDECIAIKEAAHKYNVMVSVCHVLRYNPYFVKLRELANSGELGTMISVDHRSCVGLDRTTHGFVRGVYRKEENTNPMIISKCCHDIDYLLWLANASCKKIVSFGSLRWFKKENAPEGSASRCINCNIENSCPFSAIDLYYRRRDWIYNFDIPKGSTIDEVIKKQLKEGPYGRCVYHCDNDVVDNQIVSMEMNNNIIMTFNMDIFTQKDCRETYINLTEGIIQGNETEIHTHRFRDGKETIYRFNSPTKRKFHSGSDLYLISDFIDKIRTGNLNSRSSIDDSIECYQVCYEAEKSRKENRVIFLNN